ncbi:LysR substrate-binding domain-containing protein [Pseudoxanthomonas daejeonensis]|uniref:LysR substrate-binding domain-containing protein n=1 Tax=Pseudoxanthomonas daejeonensis TaxID=266062 RepID=UPI001F544833|nr:LysR substrate-binding domain-containing protein [Pseudoxanthomonas daejeonensis]UNK58782.1 LysR substrate-binding domain-containing protein [Pseudoxanthomonas daejeonensis]
MSRLPLDQVEAFVTAARLGNLTRAAERMNLTVSALSHRMRLLEQRLGHRLLARGPRGVEPTPEGQRLFDAIAGPLATIEHALRHASVRSDNTVTLSLIPSMATAWLVPRLPAFLAGHPELALNLQSSTHVVDFEREPVDLALRLGAGHWPGVRAELLFHESIVPVASPALVERHGEPALDRLAELPLLGDPADRWKDWFARFGGQAPERYVARFDDTETLHQAAVQGMGVALARWTLAEPLVRAGRLVPLAREHLPAGFGHYLVYPERSVSHPGFAIMREWLLEQAAGPSA